MKTDTCQADMHVHSRYSHRPPSWILKKIGCAESYTDPLYLYHTLKRRGMDLVTITDHNTIGGCLEIAHLKDTFISEEVTTYFPEDNCKAHVLVYNISEQQHQDIAGLRKNLYELIEYLNREQIVHAVAHPMYSINDLLRLHHFQKFLLLFKNIELNGARDNLQNAIIKCIVDDLTAEKLEELAHQHNIAPYGDRPWEKHLISGSDDHSSLYMGYSYTQVSGATSVESFFAGIVQGKTSVQTHDSTPETLAHNIYSIMYQFYDQTFQVNRWIDDPDLAAFLKKTLSPPDQSDGPAFQTSSFLKDEAACDMDSSSIPAHFLENARSAIFADARLKDRVENGSTALEAPEKLQDNWLRFVNHVSDMIMRQFADDILARLTKADLFYLFNTIGTSGTLYMMLSPYFIAYSLFSRDRAFSRRCLEKQVRCPADLYLSGPQHHVATFTDTLNEINGVATAIQSHIAAARLTEKPLKLITCDPGQQTTAQIKSFDPIGEFDLPEYPELKIYYPPLLKILSYCYHQQFTHIHAETPGAMGLTALAIANMLHLPIRGTYHTSLPQTISALTGDSQIEDLFWKYLVWFYGQMEAIYVPSTMTGRELIDKGLPEEKIIVHQWGVDTTYFHPEKRNGYFSTHHNLKAAALKLLYVGRVSKEKNLPVLEEMIKKISRIRDDVYLIIVGEGPYLEEMQQALKDWPVIFTGYLTGESLAQAYASSDIFVFPSTVDTMGNVVVEAQASGVPVIVTDRGGPSENMRDQQTGFVVPADKDMSDTFVNTVLRLSDDPELMARMRENARRYTGDRSFENSFLTFWDTYVK